MMKRTLKIHSHSFINGYILAGGISARLGQDKRRLKLGGLTLLERTYLLLQTSLGEAPTIVGDNLDQQCYKSYRIIPDAVPNMGPLGGLVSCLRDCGKNKWALIMPVDMPYISACEIEELIKSVEKGLEVVALGWKGMIEPLAAVYNGDSLEFWEKQLKNGILSLQTGIKELHHKIIQVPPAAKALMNLNTPKELDRIIQLNKPVKQTS